MRIVLGEDSLLLREGLARLLEGTGHEVVGQAGDAEDLLRKAGAHKPDLVIVDVRMPPTFSVEEPVEVGHALFEKVAEPVRAVGEQLERVA